jgi:hypothetical protein
MTMAAYGCADRLLALLIAENETVHALNQSRSLQTSPIAGEAFDVGAANREQRQRAVAAPSGELAQVQRIRLASQAAVSGQVTGEREPFGVGESGWIMTRAVVGAAVVIGHLLAGLRPGGWASRRSQRLSGSPT